MNKKSSAKKPASSDFGIEKAKGRPMLQWAGKRPLERVDYYPAQEKELYGDKDAKDFNKLFWGDNLQVLSHLLKEYRGKINLIYIDPPFASAAEYVKTIQMRGERIEGVRQNVLEEAQYTDIWQNDEYLQFMYERLLLMKELLSDTGSIYVHMDEKRSHYMKIILDEVFGETNFQREIVWRIGWISGYKSVAKNWIRNHDVILYYTKDKNNFTFNKEYIPYPKDYTRRDGAKPEGEGYPIEDTWNCNDLDRMDSIQIMSFSGEKRNYPTQKNGNLLTRIIKASSNEGDLVADFFMGSGTACGAAQQLGRRWIGCDMNIGAVQTTTKFLSRIVGDQLKNKPKNFKGLLGFKVLNVNEYDVFKNEVEAKEIVMEMYGVERLKRSYFDGVLDGDFVKVMPLSRVLGKMDIRALLKGIGDELDNFTKKTTTKYAEAVYKEGAVIICSGMEMDVRDFLKKENGTGVEVKIYDILADTKDLIFKQYPESRIKVKAESKKLFVEIQEFYSPLLMQKLSLENAKVLKREHEAKVKDFKQIIDSVAIDVHYDGKLFNAEIMDVPDKNEVVAATYSYQYPKKGKYAVAIKIIDVLGEEYFETFTVEVK